MVKNRGSHGAVAEAETSSTQSEAIESQPQTTESQPVAVGSTPVNYTLTRHNNGGHPGGRASYTIPGVSGNMVIFPTLLADGKFPETLELFTRDGDGVLKPVPLALPKAKVTDAAKAEAAARKLQEKADKAAAKLKASEAKAAEKAAKAAAAVEAAQKRIQDAAAKTANQAMGTESI